EGSNLVLRGSEPKKAPAQRRRVFTGPVEDLSEEEVEDEEKPLLVKRLSSSAPPPPPPFDENGEEAARRHCVFFHNAPKKITEMELQRIFERAGS
ncbi:pmpB, partial [Symbiodinium pilosum]